MTAQELLDYFRSLNGGWVDPEKTVDTIKAGDPGTEIRGIAVGWMSYTWALKRALELGCNVFVTHEPTYYNHHDDDPEIFRYGSAQEKRDLVEEAGMVIMRCHDLWDRMPGIGITDSWASFLGFSEPIDGEGYLRVFDGEGRSAGEIARGVVDKTRELGQDTVQVIGPLDTQVSRLCLGTGACTPLRTFLDQYHADMAICTDDGLVYWRDAALAIDMELPLVVVNHGVSEEPGVESLARHLKARFANIPVHYVAQKCMYGVVAG